MTSIRGLFQQYLDKNLYSFEGESGVRNLEKLVKDVGGYDNVYEYLADNPSACEACVEQIREGLGYVTEWRESLIEIMKEEEDEPGI